MTAASKRNETNKSVALFLSLLTGIGEHGNRVAKTRRKGPWQKGGKPPWARGKSRWLLSCWHGTRTW